MNNNQQKKEAARLHNQKRIEAHVERVRRELIEQDKIDNPHKYKRAKRGGRGSGKLAVYLAMAAATGTF